MALTRLDCDFYRGRRPSSDSSSFVVLNAGCRPGCLVAAGSAAVKASIGSQIACRLCLEHFVDGTLQYYERLGAEEPAEATQAVLESAFKRANTAVYEFGHKLAAGGRLASAMIALVIEEGGVSAGRVGAMSAYLHRGVSLYPFFIEPPAESGGFMGANSIVTIETASVDIEGGDTILLFSRVLDERQEQQLLDSLAQHAVRRGAFERVVVPRLFPDAEELEFALFASIGPEAIYLSEEICVE